MSEERSENTREVTIVISWHDEGHFLCERPGVKVRFDDQGELSKYVARLLAWRRGELENVQYPMTAEKFVDDLVTSGRGNSVEIPFDRYLDADRYSSEAEWTSDDVRKT